MQSLENRAGIIWCVIMERSVKGEVKAHTEAGTECLKFILGNAGIAGESYAICVMLEDNTR